MHISMRRDTDIPHRKINKQPVRMKKMNVSDNRENGDGRLEDIKKANPNENDGQTSRKKTSAGCE
jgi:hypothetical protein